MQQSSEKLQRKEEEVKERKKNTEDTDLTNVRHSGGARERERLRRLKGRRQ